MNYAGLIVRRDVGDDAIIGAYALHLQRPGGNRHRRTLLGLRSHADPDQGLRHWLELGIARGHEDGRDLRGHVVDAGITVPIERWRLSPRLTIGYAMGSGDDQVDRAYRQSGVHSNEATYGGLAKFRIYGETLDPDLGNLHVLSLGVGMTHADQMSLDAIYHYYRQDVVGPVTAMNIDPDYDSRSTRTLGQALDLVLGWRPDRHWRIGLAAGWFRPSMRFAEPRESGPPQRPDDAYSLRLEVDVRY